MAQGGSTFWTPQRIGNEVLTKPTVHFQTGSFKICNVRMTRHLIAASA